MVAKKGGRPRGHGPPAMIKNSATRGQIPEVRQTCAWGKSSRILKNFGREFYAKRCVREPRVHSTKLPMVMQPDDLVS
jgi:hypothetical protein